jgi:hypothetical protein
VRGVLSATPPDDISVRIRSRGNLELPRFSLLVKLVFQISKDSVYTFSHSFIHYSDKMKGENLVTKTF